MTDRMTGTTCLNGTTWWHASTFFGESADSGYYDPMPRLRSGRDRPTLIDCLVCFCMLVASIAVLAGLGVALAMAWP